MQCSIAKLRWGAGVYAALLLAGSWVVVSGAGLDTISAEQAAPPPPEGIQLPPSFGPPSEPNDPMLRQQQRMEKARNVDRQKQLEQDTDKLLALAQQLKEQVDKSNGNTLSLDAVKTATKIENLAKGVKNRMRY